MRVILVVLCITFSLWAKPFTVAFISDADGEHTSLQKKLIMQEAKKLFKEKELIFPKQYAIVLERDFKKIPAQLKALAEQKEVDAIVALGAYSSHFLATQKRFLKPSIATVVVDTTLQKIPQKADSSGKYNLNYILGRSTLAKDLSFFKEAGATGLISIILNEKAAKLFQGAHEYTKNLKLGVEVEFIPVTDSSLEGLKTISQNSKGAYVTPVFQFDRSKKLAALFDALNKKALPTFYTGNNKGVEGKVLFSNTREDEPLKIARMVAINLQQISFGFNASELAIEYDNYSQVLLDMKVARQINYSPTWDVMLNAKVINRKDTKTAFGLDLNSGISRVLTHNLELLASKKDVELATLEVRNAKSSFLPTLSTNLQGVQIDSDRADASNGSSSEYTYSGSLSLTQSLYNESIHANSAIQKALLGAQKHLHRSNKDEVVFNFVKAYLTVLQAQSALNIQAENLNLIQKNLDLSRNKLKSGAVSRSDTLRWEGEEANAKKNFLFAQTDFHNAKESLATFLNLGIKQEFALKEYSHKDAFFKFLGKSPASLVQDFNFYRAFAAFLADVVIQKHPQIKYYDENIVAKKRELLMYKRDTYVPTANLSAELERVFERDGAEADFNRPYNDTNWQVGVALSFNLYEGGAKNIKVQQGIKELMQLKLQKQNLVRNLQQQMIQVVEEVGSTFRAIEYSSTQLERAQEYYKVIADKYSIGQSRIIDVLDAQNEVLVAKEVKNSNIYDYLENIMSVYYLLGKMNVLYEKEQKQLLEKQILDFAKRYKEGKE